MTEAYVWRLCFMLRRLEAQKKPTAENPLALRICDRKSFQNDRSDRSEAQNFPNAKKHRLYAFVMEEMFERVFGTL